MLENAWKSHLVRKFNLSHPKGFAWPFEARFKSGFPDLVFMEDGKIVFMELKKINHKRYPTDKSLRRKFSPLQIEVMKSINEALIQSYGVIRSNDDVYIFGTKKEGHVWMSLENFEDMIMSPVSHWYIRERLLDSQCSYSSSPDAK